jgi:hypothetical protein
VPDLDTDYVSMAARGHRAEHNETNAEVNSLRSRVADLEAVGWDDLRVDVTSGTTGNLNPPDLETFRDGIVAKAFAPNATEQVYFDVQLPHNWDAGTGIRPHVHWSPGNSTNTGSVVWRLEYTWANAVVAPGNVFPETTTLTVTQAAAGVAYSHQIAQWTEIRLRNTPMPECQKRCPDCEFAALVEAPCGDCDDRDCCCGKED